MQQFDSALCLGMSLFFRTNEDLVSSATKEAFKVVPGNELQMNELFSDALPSNLLQTMKKLSIGRIYKNKQPCRGLEPLTL